MDTVSLSVVAVGTVLGLLVMAQGWLLWRLTRVLASAARVEERVGHFGDALSLLTETTESGFRAVADEIGRRRDRRARLPPAQGGRTRASTPRRAAVAA